MDDLLRYIYWISIRSIKISSPYIWFTSGSALFGGLSKFSIMYVLIDPHGRKLNENIWNISDE